MKNGRKRKGDEERPKEARTEERKERRREKEGQVLEWDRAGVAPRDLEAVYDANMCKSFALSPLRKEPKIEV